jgi:hypothetical protein
MHSTISTLIDLGAIEVETAQRGTPARLRLTQQGYELLRTADAIADELDAVLTLDDHEVDVLRGVLLQLVRPPGR